MNNKDGGFRVVEVSAEKWIKPDVSDEIVDIALCQWEVLPSASDFDFLRVGAELAAQPAKFDGRPVRDFGPLFVERNANAELAKLGG